MMELDITFEESPWESLFGKLAQGGQVSGIQLLTVLEDQPQDELDQALDLLTAKHITLDISDLPPVHAGGEAATRLRLEQKLASRDCLASEIAANDPLRLFLEEVSCLSVSENVALLAEKLLLGEPGIHEKLMDCMLPRLVETAKTYTGKGVLLLDLIQEASLGLWQGIGTYSGGDILAVCDWWIHQYLAAAVLRQAIEDGLGKKLKEAVEDYRSVDEKLLAELGRNPTIDEIAQALHISVEEAGSVAAILENARELNRVKQPEPEQLPRDEDQAVENTAYFQMRQRVSELLSELDDQDAKLLSMRYGLEGGLPLDPQQVGAKLGITVQDVINREAAALAKLRQS